MRRIFKLLPFILVYLIVSAKSCDNNEQFTREREQKQAFQARDSIASAFEKDTLSEPSLRAFEVSAELKLNDLAYYIKIFNDSAADKAFKEKAGEMAAALFIPGKKIPGSLSGVIIDSVMVSKALQQMNDSTCSGQLSFTATISGSSQYYEPRGKPSPQVPQQTAGNTPGGTRAGKAISRVNTKIVDIFTLKQEKVFGKDTIRVWNVLLGDIR